MSPGKRILLAAFVAEVVVYYYSDVTSLSRPSHMTSLEFLLLKPT